MAGKAGKVWSLPRFWVSIRSYKKKMVKNILGRILDLDWLKFAVAAQICSKTTQLYQLCFLNKIFCDMVHEILISIE